MNAKDIIYLSSQGNKVTDTVKVAAFLGRRHSNITKSVRRLMNQPDGNKCFYESTYINRGATQPMFVMNRAGFLKVCATIPGIKLLVAEVLAAFDGLETMDIYESTEQVDNEIKQATIDFTADVTPFRLSKPKLIPAVEEYAKSKIELAIPVVNTKYAVNARDLWRWLESGQEFANWIKSRIERCDFIENEDYQVFDKTIKNESTPGGRPAIEYALSVDAAKECAMIEGNEKGKIARRYFIQVEKSFRLVVESGVVPGLPRNFAEALRQLANEVEQKERLQMMNNEMTKQIEADRPKVEFAQAILVSKNAITVKQLAAILCQNGVETGQIRLFEQLRNDGFLCERAGMKNQPTQRALEMGLFKIEPRTFQLPDGDTHEYTITLVTPKGQQYFVNHYLYNQMNEQGE